MWEILILFFLMRMLSVQLYTWMQPSSVPSHMVDCCTSVSSELDSWWRWPPATGTAAGEGALVATSWDGLAARSGWLSVSESSLELPESSCMSVEFLALLLFASSAVFEGRFSRDFDVELTMEFMVFASDADGSCTEMLMPVWWLVEGRARYYFAN